MDHRYITFTCLEIIVSGWRNRNIYFYEEVKLLLLSILSLTTRIVIWEKTYTTETENKRNQHLKGPKAVGAMIYNINFSLYP
jgi:hypothetical protein